MLRHKTKHYSDVIKGATASQITSLMIVFPTVNSGRSKKTSKLRVTDFCAGNSPVTGEFHAQMASNAENVSIWWRHHVNPNIPNTGILTSMTVYIQVAELVKCLNFFKIYCMRALFKVNMMHVLRRCHILIEGVKDYNFITEHLIDIRTMHILLDTSPKSCLGSPQTQKAAEKLRHMRWNPIDTCLQCRICSDKSNAWYLLVPHHEF